MVLVETKCLTRPAAVSETDSSASERLEYDVFVHGPCLVGVPDVIADVWYVGVCECCCDGE